MTDCAICYSIVNEEPQTCGHHIHLSCLEQHFKPECPVCRKKLDFKPKGKLPSSDIIQNEFIPNEDDNEEEDNEDDFQFDITITLNEQNQAVFSSSLRNTYNFSQEESETYSRLPIWKIQGFIHKEEHPDYDEENPDDLDEENDDCENRDDCDDCENRDDCDDCDDCENRDDCENNNYLFSSDPTHYDN